MKSRVFLFVILTLVLVSLSVGLGQAQGPAPQGMLGTAFTYQGQLKQNGLPVSGACDFRFSLWDAEADGALVSGAVDRNAVPVSKGLFTVLLDFGPYAFNGGERWLGIEVRCPAGSGDYTPLAPRQPLTPTPYAIFASTAPWGGLLDRPAGLDDGDDDTLAALMCAEGEVAKWDGAAWVCGPDKDTLRGLSCAAGQVVKWDGAAWACAEDENAQSAYTAGAGLILTGNEFSVAFAGTGVADTAARSDHNHDATYVNEGQPDSVTSDMIWNGAVTQWDLRDKAVTTPKLDDGAVTAAKMQDGAALAEILDDDGSGSGLDADLLDGHDTAFFQQRVAGTCPAGSSIRVVNADGTVACEADDNTTYSAGNQLSLVGTTFNVLEGSGSGLDADLLDGQHASEFAPVIHTHNAGNIISGVLSTDRYSAYADLTAEGYLDNNAGSDILTRDQADGRYLGTGTAWLLGGNAGTNPLTNFLGTTDAVSLTLAVSGTAALRLEPNAVSPNVIGGYSGNSVAAGVYGATIGGGGVSGGDVNKVTASLGTVGGGWQNTASGDYGATVGGGHGNTASGDASTVGGGWGNTASGAAATVGGGWQNTASGHYATVPGGRSSTAAGEYSFAAGLRAKANHDGAFVWADSTDADFASNAINEFAVRAGGGVRLVTGAGGLRLQANSTSPNVIGGFSSNSITSGVVAGTIGGGGRTGFSGENWSNIVTDNYGTVSGGRGNQAGDDSGAVDTRTDATVGGGAFNTASGTGSTVGGGQANKASSSYSTVSGGLGGNASGAYSAISGGSSNTASNMFAVVGGGVSNTASGQNATVPGGEGAAATHYGELAYASGSFAVAGDAQASTYVLRRERVMLDTGWYDLFLDGSTARITIASGRTMTFDILISGRTQAGESAGYRVEGIIENVGGTTSFIGTPTVTVLGEDDAAWDVRVGAAVSEMLLVQVRGNGETIRWVAVVRTAEVAW